MRTALFWALLGYYAVCSGNSLHTFGDKLSVPFSTVKNPEYGTIRLSRNVGKELLLLAA
jgi:hypothetical protein